MNCTLCRNPRDDLGEVSGLAFCSECRSRDPASALVAHDVVVEWDTRLMRFSAGVGIAQRDPDLEIECKPERWYHKLQQVVRKDFRVGDDAFDAAIWIRTSDPDRAGTLLEIEGVRSALMALLADTRAGELAKTHVTLKGPTLLVCPTQRRPAGIEGARTSASCRSASTTLANRLRTSAKHTSLRRRRPKRFRGQCKPTNRVD